MSTSWKFASHIPQEHTNLPSSLEDRIRLLFDLSNRQCGYEDSMFFSRIFDYLHQFDHVNYDKSDEPKRHPGCPGGRPALYRTLQKMIKTGEIVCSPIRRYRTKVYDATTDTHSYPDEKPWPKGNHLK